MGPTRRWPSARAAARWRCAASRCRRAGISSASPASCRPARPTGSGWRRSATRRATRRSSRTMPRRRPPRRRRAAAWRAASARPTSTTSTSASRAGCSSGTSRLPAKALPELTLYDGAGDRIVEAVPETATPLVRLSRFLLPPGHNLVRLEGSGGRWLLRARPLGPPVAGLEVEPNDEETRATTLALGADAERRARPAGRRRRLRLQARGRASCRHRADGAARPAGQADARLGRLAEPPAADRQRGRAGRAAAAGLGRPAAARRLPALARRPRRLPPRPLRPDGADGAHLPAAGRPRAERCRLAGRPGGEPAGRPSPRRRRRLVPPAGGADRAHDHRAGGAVGRDLGGPLPRRGAAGRRLALRAGRGGQRARGRRRGAAAAGLWQHAATTGSRSTDRRSRRPPLRRSTRPSCSTPVPSPPTNPGGSASPAASCCTAAPRPNLP